MAERKSNSSSRGVWLAVVLFLALLGASFTASVTLTIKVSEAEAQKLLDTQLAKLRAKEPAYDIDHVTVHFVNDHMSVEAAGGYLLQVNELPKVQATAALSSVGSPRYERGSIYFEATEFTLDSFLVNDQQLGDLVTGLIDQAAKSELPKLRDKALADPKVKGFLSKLDKLGVSVNIDPEKITWLSPGELRQLMHWSRNIASQPNSSLRPK